MKKLRIGMVIKQLNGKPQKFGEVIQNAKGEDETVERDMTMRDVITQLYPSMGGQKSVNARIISDAMLKIYNCKEEWIELENHDYTVLKDALEAVDSLVWVTTYLAKAFEESDAVYAKKEVDG